MTYYGKEPEDVVVTDLSDWQSGLRDRLAELAGVINSLPAGWAIATRLHGISLGPRANKETLRSIRALLVMAKDTHGQHERWPEAQKLIDQIEPDFIIYEAVARLLANDEVV